MSKSTPAGASGTDRYTIRSYEPGDADDVRSLFETAWGFDRETDWLAFQFEANPYLDGSTMTVASVDGEVVGACPYVPVPLRAGSRELTAAYFTNVVVRPDHRRRGLFTEMTTHAIADRADDEVSAFFCFANENSRRGYRNLGFEAFGTGPVKDVRVQRPGRVVRDRLTPPFGDIVGDAADAVFAGYRSLTAAGHSTHSGVTVDRRAGLSGRVLESLYAGAPPLALHTRRERALYEWLATDPYWDYRTYVASADGAPEAAVVVRDHPTAPGETPWIVDAAPSPAGQRGSVVAALLDAIVDDNRDATVLWTGGPVVNERLFPRETLSAFGFRSSSQSGLSRFTFGGQTAFVYPVEDTGIDLTDPDNWQIGVS